MKRRDFIQNTALSSVALGLGGLSLSSFKSADTKHLTVLHTNDVHSYIDPFPPTHPKNPNMGGVARRAALIETIKKERSLSQLNTVDVSQVKTNEAIPLDQRAFRKVC